MAQDQTAFAPLPTTTVPATQYVEADNYKKLLASAQKLPSRLDRYSNSLAMYDLGEHVTFDKPVLMSVFTEPFPGNKEKLNLSLSPENVKDLLVYCDLVKAHAKNSWAINNFAQLTPNDQGRYDIRISFPVKPKKGNGKVAVATSASDPSKKIQFDTVTLANDFLNEPEINIETVTVSVKVYVIRQKLDASVEASVGLCYTLSGMSYSGTFAA